MSSLTRSSEIGNEQNLSCLQRNNSCSCVLYENGWDDGIAIPILKDKFQRLFLGKVPTIFDYELSCYWLAALQSMQAGDYAKAIWCFRHYEITCSNDFFDKNCPFLLYDKGVLAYRIKDYALAEKIFCRYLQYDPHWKNAIAYLHLGNAFFRQEMWDKALEAYGSALELRKFSYPRQSFDMGYSNLYQCKGSVRDIAETCGLAFACRISENLYP